jgi:predicted metal-dependent hydrolase
MSEQQQNLLGVFSPEPGVHKAPPETGGVVFERSPRARNYRLTLRRDGTAVAVIPARGSVREAERFVATHREWLDRARARQAKRPRGAEVWTIGTRVLWRGEMCEIRNALVAPLPIPGQPTNALLRQGSEGQATSFLAAQDEARPRVCLASDVFRVPSLDGDLRPTLEAHFLRRGKIELPARTWELSAVTGVEVKQVTVRNQRSRWGSCSANGTISLNWRLVQTPEFVRDYIIYHELMHLREMNHSARFWARVEEVCPGWRDAERWIKRNGSLLGL